jgi:hypothetical protein
MSRARATQSRPLDEAPVKLEPSLAALVTFFASLFFLSPA